MNRFAIFAAFALVACAGDSDTKTDSGSPTGIDTTDTETECAGQGGFYDGPITVQEVSVTCDASDNVRFYARTEGWTGDGWVFSQETANPTPNWSDTHDMESYQFDACGYEDELERTLATGAAVAAWEMNVSTVFTCAAHFDAANGVMSYAVGVKDLDGNLADCLAWGQDPDGMIDGSVGRVNEPGFSLANCVVGVSAR